MIDSKNTSKPTAPIFPSLALEAKILEDASGAFSKALVEELLAHHTALKRQMRQGSSQETFDKLQKISNAIEAAVIVIKRLRKKTHATL